LLVARYWLLVTGCSLLVEDPVLSGDSGSWMLVVAKRKSRLQREYWILDAGCRIFDSHSVPYTSRLNVINLTDRFVSRKEFPARYFMISRIFSPRPYRFNRSLKNILKFGYQMQDL